MSSTSQCLPMRIAQKLMVVLAVCCSTNDALAFRVVDVTESLGLGILRWNADPHFVDGVERSLDGGLRYSIEGGSYEALRDKFMWADPAPTVAQFQAAVEQAFADWEALDPATGLGTDLYFAPDLDTPIDIVDTEGLPLAGRAMLNPGAEIDITSWADVDWCGNAESFGDPQSNSVTLTSGTQNYAAAVLSGSDIRMNILRCGTDPWPLENFQDVLSHEIGHAIGLGDVDFGSGFGGWLSSFYDDNFDDSNRGTRLATMTNPFAHLIDTLDPDNSPKLKQFDLCEGDPGNSFDWCKGIDVQGVNIHMESSPTQGDVRQGPQHDDIAARQFLYPFVRVPEDFNGDRELTVEDFDLLTAEVRNGEPRFWFDTDGNEIVEGDDRTWWVHELKNTYFGDANLDGEFNSGDLTLVFQAGQYEDGIDQNSSWSTGDWNGDGEFATEDLVVAFQDGGYEKGPNVAVNAVPEPTSCGLLLLGWITIATQRRTRRCF